MVPLPPRTPYDPHHPTRGRGRATGGGSPDRRRPETAAPRADRPDGPPGPPAPRHRRRHRHLPAFRPALAERLPRPRPGRAAAPEGPGATPKLTADPAPVLRQWV